MNHPNSVYHSSTTGPSRNGPGGVDESILSLTELRSAMLALEAEGMGRFDRIHPTYRDSARNLLHYLALRRNDIRPLQLRLAALGLSSLGRSEACVLASVEAVAHALHGLVGREWSPDPAREPAVGFDDGPALLARHTEDLLGPEPPTRQVRVTVTMPSEAAHDYARSTTCSRAA